MVTVSHTTVSVDAEVFPPEIDFGGHTALATPRVTASTRRVGPAIAFLGQRHSPEWQATVGGFIGQVSVDNQHYKEQHAMGVIYRTTAYEGDDIWVRGRPVTEDGTALFRADIQTIDYRAYDLSSATPSAEIHSEALPVDQLMSTALQVTQAWRRDTVGFTFQHQASGAQFMEGGRIYRLEYVFGLVAGGSVKHALEVATSGLQTPRSSLGA